MLLDFQRLKISHVSIPEAFDDAFSLGSNVFLFQGKENSFVVDISNLDKWRVRKIEKTTYINKLSNLKILGKNLVDSNVPSQSIATSAEDFMCIVKGSLLTDGVIKLSRIPRETAVSDAIGKVCIAPFSKQIVRFMELSDIPQNVRTESDRSDLGYLEIVDAEESTFSYLEVNLPFSVTPFQCWLADNSKPYLLTSLTRDERLVTVDARGLVLVWEINQSSLSNSFRIWKKASGADSEKQLTIEYVSEKPVSGPKHGQVDPSGAPHVGGNTWAGGTGGRDTAGLGGKGGPYRLDADHQVHQLSDKEKENVPPEVRKAAREMAQKAFQDRLKEIEMSEYDADLYHQFYGSVAKQVKTLRSILDSLQAKDKERQWLKHQTSGEFDDAKLIEGITGERIIYKRRGEQEPEVGSPQQKPKLLRIVVDVSGSMYRFNGYDARLQRELESIVLVMEAFDGYAERFKYEIVGHSGEAHSLEFSSFDKPPRNPKEKLDLIRSMHAHSQFCMSGDHTLDATDHAIRSITDFDADEYFVIVLSDANLDRYGISAASFGRLLVSNPNVNAFAIFIGSLGDQATQLSKQLPAGRAFLCLDSSQLTSILQKIFTSALLRD